MLNQIRTGKSWDSLPNSTGCWWIFFMTCCISKIDIKLICWMKFAHDIIELAIQGRLTQKQLMLGSLLFWHINIHMSQQAISKHCKTSVISVNFHTQAGLNSGWHVLLTFQLRFLFQIQCTWWDFTILVLACEATNAEKHAGVELLLI